MMPPCPGMLEKCFLSSLPDLLSIHVSSEVEEGTLSDNRFI